MLTVEQRLTRLEGQSKDPVSSALQDLHKTLDRTKFDHEDAILDLEALVKCAKLNNNPKAREYECALEEVQKRSKTLSPNNLKDLMTALVGDPVKSKVLEKTTKFLKHSNRKSERSDQRRTNQYPGNDNNYSPAYNTYRRRERYFGRNRQPYNHPARQLTCFFCDLPGHSVKNCRELNRMKGSRPKGGQNN